jgi:hypothetical protein
MEAEPTEAMATMATQIATGVHHMANALEVLGSHDHGSSQHATDEADAGIKEARNLEHTYRAAMSATLDLEDVRSWRPVESSTAASPTSAICWLRSATGLVRRDQGVVGAEAIPLLRTGPAPGRVLTAVGVARCSGCCSGSPARWSTPARRPLRR